MENKKTVVYKKSEYTAKTENDYNMLTLPNQNLIDCRIEQNDEELEFIYDITNVRPIEELRNRPLNEKLIFLIHASKMFKLMDEYAVPVAEENIYYSLELDIRLMERDKLKVRHDDSRKLEIYKSLIGYILQTKYSLEDIITGGNALLNDNKLTKSFYALDSIEEILENLYKKLEKINEHIKNNKMLIDKRQYKLKSIVSIVLIVTTIITSGICTLFYFFEKPLKDSIIQANEEYLSKNYSDVIDALKGIDVDKLPRSSKYILAYSYIISETLSEEQKRNLLNNMTISTDENVLDFWSYIGNLDYEQAAEQATYIGDNELLAYSYMKYIDSVKMDKSMSADEKDQKLSELEGKLSTVQDKLIGSGETNENNNN